MNGLKQLNLLISLLIELAMLYFYSYWAYHTGDTVVMKYTLAILVPAIVVVLWAIWAAPKSKYRLKNPYRSILKLSLCLLSALLCFEAGQPAWAIWFSAFTIVNAGLAFGLKQDY